MLILVLNIFAHKIFNGKVGALVLDAIPTPSLSDPFHFRAVCYFLGHCDFD